MGAFLPICNMSYRLKWMIITAVNNLSRCKILALFNILRQQQQQQQHFYFTP